MELFVEIHVQSDDCKKGVQQFIDSTLLYVGFQSFFS
jgi:hypothetical protein